MAIRSVIIDDEKNCLESLEWQLKEYFSDIEVLSTFNGANDAIEGLQKLQPDLVFLDIEMPGTNAFEMLNQLETVNFGVIFTTAFDQFAIQAFKINAIDYLLKPIDHHDLKLAVERFRNRSMVPQDDNLKFLVDHFSELSSKKKIGKIALSTSESFLFVDLENIVCCESEGNYTNVHFVDGKKILMSKTLKILEDILDPNDFLRINQSFVINLNHVVRYERDAGGFVILSNGMNVPMSKTKKAEFFNKFPKV